MSWLQQAFVSKPPCVLLREEQDQQRKQGHGCSRIILALRMALGMPTVDIRQLYKGGIGMSSPTLKTRMVPIYQDVWQHFRAFCQQVIILLCLEKGTQWHSEIGLPIKTAASRETDSFPMQWRENTSGIEWGLIMVLSVVLYSLTEADFWFWTDFSFL